VEKGIKNKKEKAACTFQSVAAFPLLLFNVPAALPGMVRARLLAMR
jgi:hypothetical protein